MPNDSANDRPNEMPNGNAEGTATEIQRFTPQAMDGLRQLARDRPSLWEDPRTDFVQELRARGVDEPTEPAGLTAANPIGMPPPDADRRLKPRADRHALRFLENLPGMTPERMTDGGMLAWLSCVPLLEYGISRWPLSRNTDPAEWALLHFLPESGRPVTNASVAGRTLWIAETSRRVAGETPALTAQKVLDHFANNQEHYHLCIEFQIMRSARTLSEYVLCLMNKAQGVKTNGAREVARHLNRAAGARLLDCLERRDIREIAAEGAEAVMRQPRYVADRKMLRGVEPLRVLSLGAGVQSTAMALMAETGYMGMEKPGLAIFADTGWEPKAVYEHLEWLKGQLSYEVVTVSAGDIREDTLAGRTPTGRNFIAMPVFTTSASGREGSAKRQCTSEYKLRPIFREVRKRLGIEDGRRAAKDRRAEIWLGITTDEASRAKPSREEYITNRWPLLERDVSRAQARRWLEENHPDREVPRSACIGCPYRTGTEWKHMRETDPESFDDAVRVDMALREPALAAISKVSMYLSSQLAPLHRADFDAAPSQADLMQQECEGMCRI